MRSVCVVLRNKPSRPCHTGVLKTLLQVLMQAGLPQMACGGLRSLFFHLYVALRIKLRSPGLRGKGHYHWAVSVARVSLGFQLTLAIQKREPQPSDGSSSVLTMIQALSGYCWINELSKMHPSLNVPLPITAERFPEIIYPWNSLGSNKEQSFPAPVSSVKADLWFRITANCLHLKRLSETFTNS